MQIIHCGAQQPTRVLMVAQVVVLVIGMPIEVLRQVQVNG